MDERPRPFNPRTIALIRKVMDAQRGDMPQGAESPSHKPLALLPLSALSQSAHVAPAPKPSVPRPSQGRAAYGATPLLPGMGSFASEASKPAAVKKKSVLNDDFATLSVPGAPLTDVVIVDTETTGAGPDARLVELGALRVRDGKVVERFQTLVDPEESIPAYVIRIHGITNDMVKGAPRAKPVLRAFLEFVGNRPLMAHNAAFDRRILTGELLRSGMERPDIPMFCSLRLARLVFPSAPNHRLSTLATYLKIPDPPAHRAIADCLTTAGVLVACASRHPLRTLHVVHGGVTAL